MEPAGRDRASRRIGLTLVLGCLATYRFNNGASLELRATWSRRPILTRLISDHTCRLSADYHRP